MKKRFLICLAGIMMICGCGNASKLDEEVISATNETVEETIVTVTGFDFTIPGGFTESTEIPSTWICDDNSGSTISYNEYPYSEDLVQITAEELKTELESTLSTEGYSVEVTINSFEPITLGDYEGFRIDLEYEYANTKIHQLEVVAISPSLVATIIYSDVNDSNHFAEFEASATGISAITE